MRNAILFFVGGVSAAFLLGAIPKVMSAPASRAKVKVTVTPPSNPGAVDKTIDVLSAEDNHDGTVSYYLIACGSTIEIKADKDAANHHDSEITDAATKAISKACAH